MATHIPRSRAVRKYVCVQSAAAPVVSPWPRTLHVSDLSMIWMWLCPVHIRVPSESKIIPWHFFDLIARCNQDDLLIPETGSAQNLVIGSPTQ